MMEMDPEPSQKEVEELRKKFLEKIANSKDISIHPKDVERIKTDDFWLKRFLAHTESQQEHTIEMMTTSLCWRNEVGANEIDDKVKNEILIAGGFFPCGKDIDGATMFIFKSKRYVKNQYDTNELKNCVIYWMERLERQTKGKPITLFFDMEGCGLSNMDLDFTKYLIGLFKDYYPYFLNYVLVYEMPWVLSAAFKIIKTWLPEKAVKKIKFITKKDIKDWVPLDQALVCWGGTNDYSFTFVPEDNSDNVNNINSNRKVRFEENSSAQMSDQSSTITSQSIEDGALLTVYPEGTIRFTKEHDDYISNLKLKNISSTPVTFKIKTTSPETFRVRPGYGCLLPNAEATITVCLLSAYKSSYVGKEKFLIQSSKIDNPNIGYEELMNLWKTMSIPKEHQIHLRCAPLSSSYDLQLQQNGNLINSTSLKIENNMMKSVVETLKEMKMAQKKQNDNIKTILYIHLALIVVLIGIFLYFVMLNSGYK